MTPQQIDAMKLALEALKEAQTNDDGMEKWDRNKKAIIALKEALAEHAMREVQRLGQEIEQAPVAWMDADGNVSDNNDHKCFPIPLYTKEQP